MEVVLRIIPRQDGPPGIPACPHNYPSVSLSVRCWSGAVVPWLLMSISPSERGGQASHREPSHSGATATRASTKYQRPQADKHAAPLLPHKTKVIQNRKVNKHDQLLCILNALKLKLSNCRSKSSLLSWKVHCVAPVALAGIGLPTPATASIGATACQLPTVQIAVSVIHGYPCIGSGVRHPAPHPGHEAAVRR
jgi:hypothetical protein